MAAKLTPIGDLTIPNDETIIPRLRLDQFLVSEYASVMRLAGDWGGFPPVTADQDGLVLDGVHRVIAAHKSKITKVPVITKECESAAERLLIAAAGNAAHGRRWSSRDLTTLAILAERVGLPADQLARALRIKVEKVERRPITTVLRRQGKEEIETKIYAKKAIRSVLRDRVFSEEEEAVMLRISTPHQADELILDLLRLAELDALPALDISTFRDVERAISILQGWLDRDQHLLVAV